MTDRNLSPLERYQQDLEHPDFREDPVQAAAVRQLQNLYERLINNPPQAGFLDRLLKRPLQPVKGLYVWGGTGRGKTYLVDSFYAALPFEAKYRVHFHRFMQDIHEQLKILPKTPDPLVVVARKMAKDMRLLCLDEFHVNDIADAMLLGGLLKAVFEQGISLVATSNIPINELYLNGLQRDRFLFAIDLLGQHTQEFHLAGETDYRFRVLDETGTYYVGSAQAAQTWMRDHMHHLAPSETLFDTTLTINQRHIPMVAVAEDVVWFRFHDLCEAPLWAADYLEIAQRFHTVLIQDVPQMNESTDDVAKRFMHLIDSLYDHGVKTVITAAAEPDGLYHGRYLAFPFQRTVSRLMEMGTPRYLARPHRSAK